MAVTMVSRLMLNLYAAAKPGLTTTGGPSADLTVGMIFTTHIDAMPSLGSSGCDSDGETYHWLPNTAGLNTAASGLQVSLTAPHANFTSASHDETASHRRDPEWLPAEPEGIEMARMPEAV
jgi:hypothetical protein